MAMPITSNPSLGLRLLRWISVSLLIALEAFTLGAGIAAGDIVYLYDDFGRLARVILEDGEAASYHYDPVGNLLAITRESGLLQATTIGAISRGSAGRGTTVSVTLSGTNLIGASVACASEDLVVENLRTSFDALTLEMVVGSSAPLGPTTCEVRGLDAHSFLFTIVPPPDPTLAFSQAVSISTAAPPLAVDRNVLASLSLSWGVAGPWFSPAPALTVTREPAINAVSPASGSAGTASLDVTLSGVGLAHATSIEFLLGPVSDNNITLLSLTATTDGTTAIATIAIAGAATPGPRLIRLSTPDGVTTAAATATNLFTVE